MRKITSDIVAKLWNLCNVLKDDGVTYHQYVTEWTYLLFLKMAQETGQEDQLPAGQRWADLTSRSAPEWMTFYKLLMIHLGSNGNTLVQEIFANASSFIKKPATLSTLELAEGGNQPNLNLSKIKEFPLPPPSLEEQTEIVRRVESLLAVADRLEARCASARAQVENLTPATLAKAFRGELVPQDPNDEPASVLLERIRAKRGDPAAGNSKPKRVRKSPQARNHEETPC